MNSEIFYKKKMKKSRSSIIMKIGKEIRKTFTVEHIKIHPLNFSNKDFNQESMNIVL